MVCVCVVYTLPVGAADPPQPCLRAHPAHWNTFATQAVCSICSRSRASLSDGHGACSPGSASQQRRCSGTTSIRASSSRTGRYGRCGPRSFVTRPSTRGFCSRSMTHWACVSRSMRGRRACSLPRRSPALRRRLLPRLRCRRRRLAHKCSFHPQHPHRGLPHCLRCRPFRPFQRCPPSPAASCGCMLMSCCVAILAAGWAHVTRSFASAHA